MTAISSTSSLSVLMSNTLNAGATAPRNNAADQSSGSEVSSVADIAARLLNESMQMGLEILDSNLRSPEGRNSTTAGIDLIA